MLSLLQIRNFAIIESLDLELSQGFTAITGETGAGKSILVDALGLLMGGRADTGAIRAECDKAELTAEFDLEEEAEALEWLQNSGLDDGRNCLLRRVVSEGRSRAWINGTAVTLSQLQELGECLVEIHGQNEHIRLVRNAEQYRLLDADPACQCELEETRLRFGKWQENEQALLALEKELPLAAGELDLLQYQIEELEPLALSPEAYEELESEHRLLAKGSDVLEALEKAREALEADESGVGAQAQRLADSLAQHGGLDPNIANAAKALEEAAINCEEARSSLQGALARIDLSPERLAELDQSISRLHELGRKHRIEPASLRSVLEDLKQRIEHAHGHQDLKRELQKKQVILLREYRSAAKKLHIVRGLRAEGLSKAVSELMQVLGMEGGIFELKIEHDPEAAPSRRGDDRLDLRVSANPGIPPAPLKKVASGGELSRISLAVKVASSAGQSAPTQVFDEVDAGIGGETANSVGRLLQSVAAHGQALCVTHLAQVAVCADQQFRVVKDASAAATQVETRLLGDGDRIDEIARMLGGRLSEQSRAHASELLASALTRH